MFIETLHSPYYEHVLGSVSSNFSDIVTIDERIEHGLKSGKIAQNPSTVTNAKKPGFNNNNRKKEGEVQAASAMPYWGGYQRQYRPNYRPSHAYMENVVPNYQYNAPRHKLGIDHQWQLIMLINLIQGFRMLIRHKITILVKGII